MCSRTHVPERGARRPHFHERPPCPSSTRVSASSAWWRGATPSAVGSHRAAALTGAEFAASGMRRSAGNRRRPSTRSLMGTMSSPSCQQALGSLFCISCRLQRAGASSSSCPRSWPWWSCEKCEYGVSDRGMDVRHFLTRPVIRNASASTDRSYPSSFVTPATYSDGARDDGATAVLAGRHGAKGGAVSGNWRAFPAPPPLPGCAAPAHRLLV